MPDITMCDFKKCPKSKGCHRFTAQPNEMRQSYFIMEKDFDWKTCEHFWSNGKYKGEMRRIDDLGGIKQK